MAAPQTRSLARRLADLEKQRLLAKQPTLGFSTIVDGAIPSVDEDDAIKMILGKQFDGTQTAAVLAGPTPPTPTLPLVLAQPGALRIYWDGTFEANEVAPMDFARVLAYAVPLAEYVSPDPLDQTIIVGQFTSATGGEITAALDPGVEYVVYLVTWTEAGIYSAASDIDFATVGEAGGAPATDGNAPTSAPVAVLIGAIGGLVARWSEVTDNPDPILAYRVYLAAGSAPTVDPANEIAVINGDFAFIRKMPDGSPLDVTGATTYYAVVTAEDADGQGPGSAAVSAVPALVNSEDLAVNAITADLLIANDALIDALSVADLSTVNLEAVNIDGGSIAIAIGADGDFPEEFSGTTLPSGWTSTKNSFNGEGSGDPDVPGVSVVDTGAPSGTTGSALKIDYGTDGILYDYTVGTVMTDTPDAAAVEIDIRLQQTVTPSAGDADAQLRLIVRQQGLSNGVDEDGVAIYLNPWDGLFGDRHYSIVSRVNGTDTLLGSVDQPLTQSIIGVWTRVKLRCVAGLVQAKIWEEGTTEPDWTTVQLSANLSPGSVALQWEQFCGIGDTDPSTGQKTYIDFFDVSTFSVGFQVNPDGTTSVGSLEVGDLAVTGDAAILGSLDVGDLTVTGDAAIHGSNGWVNVTSFNSPYTGSSVQYRIDPTGEVRMRGGITRNGAASGAVAFTLPVGFRPTGTHQELVVVAPAGSATGFIAISSNGDVAFHNAMGTVNVYRADSLFSTL